MRRRCCTCANPPMSSPGKLPPIAQENQQILHADGAVAVEVGWAVLAITAWTPTAQKNEQISHANDAVAVEIAGYGR